MTITKIAFVGHPVRDMEASKRFWGEIVGLEQALEHDKWCEFDAPDGKTIALDGFFPDQSQDVYVALETDDIEAEVARMRGAGVTIEKDVWDNRVCKMALIADPQGRTVMLHQIAPSRVTP